MSDTPLPQLTADQASKAPESKTPSMTSWLFDSSMKLAIVTATLFITGWFYAGAFFDVFGLDIRTLDLPFYVSVSMAIRPMLELLTFSTVGFSFSSSVIVGVLAFVFMLALVFQEWYGFQLPGKLANKVREWLNRKSEEVTARSSGKGNWFDRFFVDIIRVLTITFVLLLLLVSVIWVGKFEGEDYKLHPRIRACLNFKADEKAELNDKLRKANGDGKLRVLIQTKDLIVVFAKGENGVFIVPRANLFSIHDQPIESKTTPKDDANACLNGQG